MYSDGLIELLNLNLMKKIWVLIYVHRGFIQEPEIFSNKKSAESRMKVILKNFNQDYDEIGIYQKVVYETHKNIRT